MVFSRRLTRKRRFCRKKRFRKMKARNILPSLPASCYVDVYILHNYYLVKHHFYTADDFATAQLRFNVSETSSTNGIPWISYPLANCYSPYPRHGDAVHKRAAAMSYNAMCIRGERTGGVGSADYWLQRNDTVNTKVIGNLENAAYLANVTAPNGSNSELCTKTQPKGWDGIMRWYDEYRPVTCKIRGYVMSPTRSEALHALVRDGLTADYTDPDGYALWMDQCPMYVMTHLGPYSCDAGSWNYDYANESSNVLNMFGEKDRSDSALPAIENEGACEQFNATWVELAKRKSVKVMWLNQSDSRERTRRLKVDYKIPYRRFHENDADEEQEQRSWNSTNRPWSNETTAAAINTQDNHTSAEGWGWWSLTFGYKIDTHTHADPTVHQDQDTPANTDQYFDSHYALLYCNFTQKWRCKLRHPKKFHDNKQYVQNPENVH